MDLGSVGNTFISTATQATQAAPEAAAAEKANPDRDGRAGDNTGVNAAKAAAGPTTNAKGHEIGQVISTTA